MKKKITLELEVDVPNQAINWKQLWIQFDEWYEKDKSRSGRTWSAQKKHISDLADKQLKWLIQNG